VIDVAHGTELFISRITPDILHEIEHSVHQVRRRRARKLKDERWHAVISVRRLTFEFTRLRKRAKPAVAGRVQRRVRQR
jgi:hypothetical protein